MVEPRDPVDVEMDDLAARSAAYMAEHPADGSRASFIREALAGTAPWLVEVAINLADEYLPKRAPSKPTPVDVEVAARSAVDALYYGTPDSGIQLAESDSGMKSLGAVEALNDAAAKLNLPNRSRKNLPPLPKVNP